jgi:hypothetical protein
MRHHLKSFIAVTMFLAAFVCASVVWATSRSPAQQKAAKKCDDQFMADVQRCLREHPELSPNDCSKAAAGGWRVCMNSAGLAKGGEVHPPKVPIQDRPKNPPTTVGTASATPSKLNPRGKAISGESIKTATPTPTPVRKPTPVNLSKEKKS